MGPGQSETELVPSGLIGPATPPVFNRSSRESKAMAPSTNPFGKVSYKPVERNAEGKEVKRRTGVAADLTPYAEFIKMQLAEHPDEWIVLDFPTGEIIKKGDTGATKKNIGRGREEYKHAKAFEDAAKQVLGMGQPKIEALHNQPEDDDPDAEPTTTLSMRFYEKRTYTAEQDRNRVVGQAEGRVTRATNKAKSAKLAADAEPDNTELADAYKAAASKLSAARKALKELKGNGEGK